MIEKPNERHHHKHPHEHERHHEAGMEGHPDARNQPALEAAREMEKRREERRLEKAAFGQVSPGSRTNAVESPPVSQSPPADRTAQVPFAWPPPFEPRVDTNAAAGGEKPPGIGPRSVAGQQDLEKAQLAFQDAENGAAPAEIRLLEQCKQEAKLHAAQMAGQGGSTSPEFLLDNTYAKIILREAGAGKITNARVINAAKDFLQKEDALRLAYAKDAWEGVADAWKNATAEWQNFYKQRWNDLRGTTSNPWKAFSSEVVANAAPQEEGMKKACQAYLNIEELRRTNMNPILYPMALSGNSNQFAQNNFATSGLPMTFGSIGGASMDAMFASMRSAIAMMESWITNLWSFPAVSFYNPGWGNGNQSYPGMRWGRPATWQGMRSF